MKKLILFTVVCLSMVLCGCEETDISLKGETYCYSIDTDHRDYYEFKSNRKVVHTYIFEERKFVYGEKGTSLYYEINGNKITIYYGAIGWRPEVQHTVYAEGTFHGDYIIIKGDRYDIL